MSRLALLMLVSLLVSAAGAPPPHAPPTLGRLGGAAPVGNGAVQVAPTGKPGAYTGFTLTAEGAEVARVLFCSDGALTARAVQASKGCLRFSGLACAPTPALGPGSFVEVRLLPGDPYPEVRFQLDLERFDKAAWEKRFGKVPFHFLTCSRPGSEVFHQRGWMIGTPVIDDYIQRKAIGPGRTVVSSWSRDWMYAPPIGAYPMAVAGLWNPSKRRYVGYDFHGARLTEHTEKCFGTSYATRCGGNEEFFCLTWPYGKGYIDLRYPTTPVTCGTRFRVLWSREMGPDDDPNYFVNRFIWSAYGHRLPASEGMNDLSWLPETYRITDFAVPGPLGDFVHNTGPDGERWWEPNVNLIGGIGYFSPIDYYYGAGQQASIEKLGREARKIIGLGQWMDVADDRCFFWQTPLDGGGAKMFGPGVETVRHVNGWYGGIALLDYCRNDAEGTQDIVPYVDGVLRWTKQILYTRNCYPDVPAAQFAWSATPCVTFCFRYYYHFRNDPERKELAALAYKLARNMTYRYLAIWPCDNDEMDDLDASFMMEPNAGLPWLGCACANEIWVYNIAMLYEYVATGDPIMGHYLRGMLERYHEMFQDQWHPSVRAYGGAFTERYGFFEECAQGKGVRGDFGGLWGGFERLVWPLGSARARVVCGEKAAMAFNRDGRHTDIADYRATREGDFSFTLVPYAGAAADAARFDVTVTFPFFDLRAREIALIRDGATALLGEDRLVRYPAESSTITVKGVRHGDTLRVGNCDESVPVLPCKVIKPRQIAPPYPPKVGGDKGGRFAAPVPGFRMVPLGAAATLPIKRDWGIVTSYAGYEPGVKKLYGVPLLLLDPTGGQGVAASGRQVPVNESPHHLFLLVDGVTKDSAILLHREGKSVERVSPAGAVPAVKGWPPVLQWHLDLVVVENAGKPVRAITPQGCRLFAVTTSTRPAAALAPTLTALKEKRARILAEEAMVREMAKLEPLFGAMSGHIAILPSPDLKNPRSNAVVKMLDQARLTKHVRLLTAEELVNPAVFNGKNIWVALYLGGEAYYQSVHREGDGEEALLRWLKGGGTLVSLAGGPFPFYYNEKDKPVVAAPRLGLPICGSGALDRLDTLDAADVRGWEKPPADLGLTMHVSPTQQVLAGLPKRIPWKTDWDQRWRPLANVVGKGNTYTPLITLKDAKGRKYGEAAAMIDYATGDLAGARVLYLWHALRLDPAHQRTLLCSLFRYLLMNTRRPLGEYACLRAGIPPTIDGKLDDEVWRQTPATEAFVRFDPDRGKGRALKTTARLAWDDRNLYVAWECEDPDVWSEITRRDGNLWEGEVVEVYVDPVGDGLSYRELEINPRNTVIDLKIPRSVKGVPQDVENARLWNAEGWRTAVQVDGTLDNRGDRDRGWTAETAIPLAALLDSGAPPKVGDVWRAQLLRIDRSKPLPAPQYSAWSDTDTFHNPGRFGRLVFVANPCADDFSAYAPGGPPTPTWVVTGGEWRVEEGVLVGKNSGSDAWSPTGVVPAAARWGDCRVRLRFQVREHGGDHRDGAWIGLRYTAPNECYSLNFGSVVQLHKLSQGRASGDTQLLASASWPNDAAWHEAAITLRGPRITVELDGKPLLDVEDKDFLGVPPLQAGGLCLSARRWTGSKADTVVTFDDIGVDAVGDP